MYPRLIHIYGPVWIHSYGVMVALGFLIFLYLFYKDKKRCVIIQDDLFFNAVFIGLFAGIIGGRLITIVTDFEFFKDNLIEIFYPWVGGFGMIGSILGVLITVPFYLKKHSVPIFPLLDRAVIYAPLIQAIARWGCFLAGCCYGKPATPSTIFSVVFTNEQGLAPLNIPLHATQLYSSFVSFLIFLFMFFLFQKVFFKRGQLLFIYLMLESLSRFSIDFFRGDRSFLKNEYLVKAFDNWFSFTQLIALIVLIFAIIGFAWVSSNSLICKEDR